MLYPGAGASIGDYGLTNKSFQLITTLTQLPNPVNGVISLQDNMTYFFSGTIDLLGNRIVCGQNTTLLGGSSENTALKSTGLTGSPLITSQNSLPMRGLSITAETALDLNGFGNPTAALDWFGVNFLNCGSVGTIANYSNFIATDCAWLESGDLTFDGSIGTIGFNSCLMSPPANQAAIIIPETAVITRRFRIIYSAISVQPGETGVSFSALASVPVEGYILDSVNFSGGGTYISGVDHLSEKSLFVNCRGISNSSSIGHCAFVNNQTATTVTAANTFYKIAGTTTEGPFVEKFSHSNNRLTYTGALSGFFQVTAVCTVQTATNVSFSFRAAKNGQVSQFAEATVRQQSNTGFSSATVQDVFELVTGDFIELFVTATQNGQSVTVSDMDILIKRLN